MKRRNFMQTTLGALVGASIAKTTLGRDDHLRKVMERYVSIELPTSDPWDEICRLVVNHPAASMTYPSIVSSISPLLLAAFPTLNSTLKDYEFIRANGTYHVEGK